MYELIFWKYQEGVYLNHHEVYEAIDEKKIIDGLEDLPTDVILNRIENKFPDWQKVDDNSWKSTNNKGAFQVHTTKQSVKIDCYGTQGKTMDMLVDILEEFQCPLYDPEIPMRYDEFCE